MEKLFNKYFEGALSHSEEKELWAYIRESSDNENAFRAAEKAWRKSHAPASGMERDFSSIVSQIKSRKRKTSFFRISAVAASLALVASLGIIFLRDKTYEYVAEAGSVEEFVLPDGSSVSLNSGSTLQFTTGRRSRNRTVVFSGEAYFDFASDKEHPFVVNTENFSITVLGTKFMVSDYPEDKFSQVVLTEGSISLNALGEHRSMSPGDRVVCDGVRIYDSAPDSAPVCQWLSDIISYEDVELGEFLRRLEREFNVVINLEARGFAGESFRASFSRSDSIGSILETICNIFPLKIVKKEDTYSLIFTKSTN